jgi:hypothetical protein
MSLATFWAIISQTHLVTLISTNRGSHNHSPLNQLFSTSYRGGYLVASSEPQCFVSPLKQEVLYVCKRFIKINHKGTGAMV